MGFGFGGFGGFVSSVVSPVTSLSLSAVSPVTDALGLKPKKPKLAQPEIAVMPTPDDKAVADARRRAMARRMARGGRASTILTQDRESLG